MVSFTVKWFIDQVTNPMTFTQIRNMFLPRLNMQPPAYKQALTDVHVGVCVVGVTVVGIKESASGRVLGSFKK